MAVKWTKEQQLVIDARNKDILVSAAAGSGKTAVLVERILKRIMDQENPVDIDRLLIVTFTNAAASEMRGRIRDALEKQSEKEPDNEHLQRQLVLVHNAKIMTIHSFCLHVLRNHFQTIGIDPAFRIADQGEVLLLEQEVVHEIVNEAYEMFGKEDSQGPEAADVDPERDGAELSAAEFTEFLEQFATGRDDAEVEGQILQIYHFALGQPFPEKWLRACREAYGRGMPLWEKARGEGGAHAKEALQEMAEAHVEKASRSEDGAHAEEASRVMAEALSGGSLRDEDEIPEWLRFIESDTALRLSGIHSQLEAALLIAQAPDGPYPYEKALLSDLELVEELESANTYADYLEAFHSMPAFARLGTKKDPKIAQEKKEQVQAIRADCKEQITALRDQYYYDELKALQEAYTGSAVVVRVLTKLTERFMRRLSEKKAEKNILDFGDMEHLALHALVDEDLVPTAVAREYAETFEEVMTDEYQDSNSVQELILNSVSGKGVPAGVHNRFMVGDVKQSIYRFRLAKPELFMEKYHRYPPLRPKEAEDAEETAHMDSETECRIDLHRNFRSRRQVLDSVNYIFSQVMTEALGGVEYDADAALYPGAEFPEASGMFGDDGGMECAAEAASAWMTESMKTDSLENASAKTGCAAALLYTSELLLLDGSTKKRDALEASDPAKKQVAQTGMDAVQRDGGTQTAGTGSDAAGDSTDDTSGDSVDLRREEARMVGRRIRELVGSMPVLDKESGAFRPARYGDIVILLRTVSGWAEVFGEVLADMGISCFTGSQKGYFSAAEVRVVLSYLQILDNPQQDIPLAAVLRSAIGRFTDEELARIRLAGSVETPQLVEAAPDETVPEAESAAREDAPKAGKAARGRSFYDCCRIYMDLAGSVERDQMADAGSVECGRMADDGGVECDRTTDAGATDTQDVRQPRGSFENDGILKKLRDFFAVYEALRQKSGHTPIHQLLWELLDVTGYGEYAAALPAGRQRKANLDMLVEKAIAYEATSYRGLYHFVRYIENLQKYEVDYGEANIGSEADDTVRIMSIHKSKGLEFPIVFVSGLGKRFNESDVRGKVVMHPDWGIACDYVARLSTEEDVVHTTDLTALRNASAETLADDQYPRIRQTTLLKKAIQQKLKNENLGEELRVLYVAMTRAKEKLILTGASRQSRSDFKNAACDLAGAADAARAATNASRQSRSDFINAACDNTLDYSTLAGASAYLDWVLPALMNRSDETYFDIHIYSPEGNAQEEKTGRMSELFTLGELLRVNPDVCQDEETREYLEQVFASGYPYESSLTIPGKLTVSELKKASQTVEETDARELYPVETVVPLVPRCVARSREEAAKNELLTEQEVDDSWQSPATGGIIDGRGQSLADGGTIDDSWQSLADGGDSIEVGVPDLAGRRISGESRPVISGAARGTLYHTFMENFDFSRKEELRFQLEELINCGKMSRDEAGQIRLGDISAFLRSEIGQRMARADQEGKLFREQPFVLGVPAKDIYQDPTLEDTILVQGIIDAWFIEGETAHPMEFAARKDAPEETITIVDYKTDRVQSGKILVKRYRAQIDYYTKALEQLTGRKVRSRVIYSFHLREAIVL